MAEIRAVLVDDEPLARRGLRQLAAEHDDLALVGEAGDGAEGVRLVREVRPDVLFLDVEMPEVDGFGVLLHGLEPPPVVVFVTAYEDFAFRAFQVDAADYLLKPVSAERFAACMERVRGRLGRAPAAARVVVSAAGRRVVLQPAEIDWIEADDYYAAVHAGGRRSLVRESLASLEARLPEALFVRAHRGALVNLGRVRTFAPNAAGGGTLTLRSGGQVPVSRRNRAAVVARLGERGRG
ncbi:MAG: DNA-binding response regulator [Gemmatimonadota bacterium]